jgi:hypothetical protein
MSFIALTSSQKTGNEKHVVGSDVIFNYYPKSGQEKPNRYRGKVTKNSEYNRIEVEVLEYIYNEQTMPKPLYGVKFLVRIGDKIKIHTGNITWSKGL